MRRGRFREVGPSCGATFIVRLAAALLLVLTTAGCYVTQFQVFSRKESVAVPGLDGRYIARLADEPDRVSHVTIFQERETGDYHYLVYEHFPHDPERQEVTADIPFRAVPLGSGLYVVQSCIHPKAKYSPRISCGYLFCRVVRSGDTIPVRLRRASRLHGARALGYFPLLPILSARRALRHASPRNRRVQFVQHD